MPEVIAPLEGLRTRIEQFADLIAGHVKCARPKMPPELWDRQADVTFPLLAIADMAGGEWPDLARRALVALCTSGAASQSKGEQLLADIRKVLSEKSVDRISSVDLAEALGKIEDSPWAEWGRSEKPITAAKMASQLKPYDIHPHPVRDGSKVFKGYEVADFEDAWTRYVAPPPVQAPQKVTRLQPSIDAANKNAACNRVTDSGAPAGTTADGYIPDPEGPGCICGQCGHHFGTAAGWKGHVVGKRCSPVAEHGAV